MLEVHVFLPLADLFDPNDVEQFGIMQDGLEAALGPIVMHVHKRAYVRSWSPVLVVGDAVR